jgi:hypothetical protein
VREMYCGRRLPLWFFFVGSAGCVREMRIGFSLVSLTSGAKLNSLRGNGLG